VNDKSQGNKEEAIFQRERGRERARASGITKEVAGLLQSTEKQKGDTKKSRK
jgi:hypothetical protein